MKKTDNANIGEKVALRRMAVERLERKPLNVLDLYAGENVLWNHFKTDYYYGVEAIKGKGRNQFYGDCRKLVPHLDLGKFNLIDCDAYGSPVEVIQKLFENETLKPGTIIVYTNINYRKGRLPKELYPFFGGKEMYNTAATLFFRYRDDAFDAILYGYGVKCVYEYTKSERMAKRYGFFQVPAKVNNML